MMRTEVLRIQRRLGVATLYVTHDQTEAMTMGDRVAVRRAGVLQQLASPQELYDRPSNLFVTSFTGSPSMNLYQASVAGPLERPAVWLGSQKLALPAELGRRKPALVGGDGRGLSVGIRPKNLTVPSGLPPDETAGVAADESVFAGGEGVGGAVVANGVARLDPATRVVAGERVTFSVDAEALHFFDPETGLALEDLRA